MVSSYSEYMYAHIAVWYVWLLKKKHKKSLILQTWWLGFPVFLCFFLSIFAIIVWLKLFLNSEMWEYIL